MGLTSDERRSLEARALGHHAHGERTPKHTLRAKIVLAYAEWSRRRVRRRARRRAKKHRREVAPPVRPGPAPRPRRPTPKRRPPTHLERPSRGRRPPNPRAHPQGRKPLEPTHARRSHRPEPLHHRPHLARPRRHPRKTRRIRPDGPEPPHTPATRVQAALTKTPPDARVRPPARPFGHAIRRVPHTTEPRRCTSRAPHRTTSPALHIDTVLARFGITEKPKNPTSRAKPISTSPRASEPAEPRRFVASTPRKRPSRQTSLVPSLMGKRHTEAGCAPASPAIAAEVGRSRTNTPRRTTDGKRKNLEHSTRPPRNPRAMTRNTTTETNPLARLHIENAAEPRRSSRQCRTDPSHFIALRRARHRARLDVISRGPTAMREATRRPVGASSGSKSTCNG